MYTCIPSADLEGIDNDDPTKWVIFLSLAVCHHAHWGTHCGNKVRGTTA